LSVGDLLADDISMSPNPMTEQMQISFPSATKGNTSVQVLDTQGQLVLTKQSNGNQITIVKEEILSAGVYIISINQDGQTVQKKFIVL